MPGRPVDLVRQGPTVLAVGAGMGCFFIFFLTPTTSFCSPLE